MSLHESPQLPGEQHFYKVVDRWIEDNAFLSTACRLSKFVKSHPSRHYLGTRIRQPVRNRPRCKGYSFLTFRPCLALTISLRAIPSP
jgi:hypothetical protein